MQLVRSKWLLLLFVSAVACQQSGQYDSDYQQEEVKAPRRQPQYEEQQVQQQENEGSAGGVNRVDASVPEPPSQIPETSFVCDDKQFDPGMYADMETGCRVYHMCFRGRKEDFICGTGTVFNQELLTCDYQANVNCDESPSFYGVNADFGKGAPEPSGDQQPAARPAPRPSAGKPRPPAQQPDYRSTGSAPQPSAGKPAPQRPSKANPRPASRPAPPAYRPPPPPAPPAKGRPAQRPAPLRPRPAQRPVVQVQDQEQALDYEPSQQVVQRRQLRNSAGPAARRNVAAFRQPSQRWQMMSQNY